VHHIAFAATTRNDVDTLYRLLLEIGAQILDTPQEYTKYEPGYYAVFFLDPDGIKLECVFTPDL
jgi:glyoxylase I family protein